jgi:type I restriction enzyme R subunit
MDMVVREATLEATVVEALTERGYTVAKPTEYDRELCLIPDVLVRFLQVTQPLQWKAYRETKGPDAAGILCRRVRDVIERKGTLHVLNKGVDESGHHFDLCYMPPASGLNPELEEKFRANFFQVMRQLAYEKKDQPKGEMEDGKYPTGRKSKSATVSQLSKGGDKALDLGIFLNGLPLFTAELKNELTGQSVVNAIQQYRKTRDPRQPLFHFGRCLAHFAVDTKSVYMATALDGETTEFLPFNQGWNGGAGNPPRLTGIATAYLWEEIWQRERIMDIVLRFMRIVKKRDRKGKDTGKQVQIFPRYHQLETVRKLTEHAQAHGAGYAYLNQHSAGSGKTIEIATLANSLATLHNDQDKVVFKTVIVLSDRRVIDRQLQSALEDFTPTRGMLENIDRTSRQLRAALEDGKKIIVTTIQKFPVILDDIGTLPTTSFAVIIDEAHSSQAGETAGQVTQVLSYGKLEETKEEEEKTWEDKIDELLARRGRMQHVSFFAFTATPKDDTLQLFATKEPNGKRTVPFTLYTMRQAIEEGFILDVLENYVTYNQYFHLFKKISSDPAYEKSKAVRLLKKHVAEHPHSVKQKARIMVDHFMAHMEQEMGGKSKGMVVTRSRLHAVRYFTAIREYLKEINAPFKCLVAFTGKIEDKEEGGVFNEGQLNDEGYSDDRITDAFDTDDYRLLIVASKYQTGFDQPLLQAMYLDRRVAGVTAVQTLSRLNRHPAGKDSVVVIDFENQAEEITEAFQKYYDQIKLKAEVDQNTLYNIRTDLEAARLFTTAKVDEFCQVRFSRVKDEIKIQKLHSLTDPLVEQYKEMEKKERVDFKSKLRDYVKCYAFLSQLIAFQDPRLEKLYHFGRFLVKKLPAEGGELPTEILDQVDMGQYKPKMLGEQEMGLERGTVEIEARKYGGGSGGSEGEKEALSKIIEDLNQMFSTDYTKDDEVVIQQLESQLSADKVLAQQMRSGSRDAARLSFEQVAHDMLFDLIDSNFRFYKKVQDDENVSRVLFDRLFDRYFNEAEKPATQSGGSAAAKEK